MSWESKTKGPPMHHRFYGVMVSTLDFEFSDPSSNLGRTYCLAKKTKVIFGAYD